MIKVKNKLQQKIIERVYEYGQGHIFKWWEELTDIERRNFLFQLSSMDFSLLNSLTQKYFKNRVNEKKRKRFEPANSISIPRTKDEKMKALEARKIGEEMLKAGKIACFLVAGGQSTRLNYNEPKGMFQITPIKNKSLYQLHAEKIFAIEKKYKTYIPWYIMTSDATDQATKIFFEKNDYFHLNRKNIIFLKQNMMPSMDFRGKLIMNAKANIAMNPNGHGGSLKVLKEGKTLEKMKKRGIEHIFYFQVDNALLKMADPLFIGYHILHNSDMSSKVVLKKHPEEKIGVIGYIDNKIGVIEYSELNKENAYARNKDGSLKFNIGNIAIHMLKIKFIEKIMSKGFKLPYHIAKKKIPYLDEDGNLVKPKKPNGIKFETFIFDILTEAKNPVIMEVMSEEEFHPLKNKEKNNSPQTVKEALINLYSSWLEAAGIKLSRDKEGKIDVLIEISPLFALDKESFIEKAKDKNIVIDNELYLE